MQHYTIPKKQSLLFVALLFFIVPQFASAEWYWITVISDPNTGYFIEEISPNTIGYSPTNSSDPYANKTLVPENFMDTMDETKTSDMCSGELDSAIQRLRQFDSNEEIVNPSLKCNVECSPYYANPEQTMTAREQLLSTLENDAQSCLINEQKKIDEAIAEQERKEAEEARIVEVQKAVSECDFDYFENEMTNKERMDSWEQREACKAKNVVEVTSEPKVESESPVVVPTQTSQPLIQTPVVTPTYTPPATQADNANIEPEETEKVATTSTTTAEAVEQPTSGTQEVEVVSVPEPEKPTLFQRVIRFFTGWFK